MNILLRNFHCFSRTFVRRGITSDSRRPLIEEHSEFLSLVGAHGEGEISVNKINIEKSQALVLKISNYQKRNAISGRMMMQLATILDDLLSKDTATQNDVIGLILRGQGDTFCAGADLSLVKEFVNTSERGMMMSRFMTDALTRLRTSKFVSVAVLDGPAVGGGAELSTVADYRVMVDRPQNHVCFIHAKLGASPGWGGAYRLQSIVGRNHALRLLGTSEKISPQEGLNMGLIDKSVPIDSYKENSDSDSVRGLSVDGPLQAAIELLRPFAKQPYADAVAAMKETVGCYEFSSAEVALDIEHQTFGRRWGSKDNKNALKQRDSK